MVTGGLCKWIATVTTPIEKKGTLFAERMNHESNSPFLTFSVDTGVLWVGSTHGTADERLARPRAVGVANG